MFIIEFRPRAKKQLKKVHAPFLQKIITAIDELVINPFPSGKKFKKLQQSKEFRRRIGAYRIIYFCKCGKKSGIGSINFLWSFRV